MKLLGIGSRIKHLEFGLGVVTNVTTKHYWVTFIESGLETIEIDADFEVIEAVDGEVDTVMGNVAWQQGLEVDRVFVHLLGGVDAPFNVQLVAAKHVAIDADALADVLHVLVALRRTGTGLLGGPIPVVEDGNAWAFDNCIEREGVGDKACRTPAQPHQPPTQHTRAQQAPPWRRHQAQWAAGAAARGRFQSQISLQPSPLLRKAL